jgi:putative transposase
VAKILLYAALLSLLVNREPSDLVTEEADSKIVFTPERWAATFRSHAQLILHKLGEYFGYSPSSLLERLIEDAQKVHQQRPILLRWSQQFRLQVQSSQIHSPEAQ